MKKKEIATIILQEAEIKRLTARNKSLERSNRSLWKENEKLRQRAENPLEKVNV
jgi:FtsZ-binding cell division protein ZapB